MEIGVLVLAFISVMFNQEWYRVGFYDILSRLIILLTIFFFMLFIIMAVKYSKEGIKVYKVLVFSLRWAVIVCFWFKRMWAFYIFFEFRLIPLLVIIYWYGYQVERLQASFYLFFYTMLGSLPLLFRFLYLTRVINFSSFFIGEQNAVWFSSFIRVALSFIFFIKLPVFLFHLWLPKAHVEAPAIGSIILAAILLKLGGYGLYRIFFIVKEQASVFLIVLSLWGALLRAVICSVQSDIKGLVAYSSISHMGVIIGGFFLLTNFRLKGFIIILVSHAFCSSALFYYVNVLYERSMTRQIVMTRAIKAGVYYILIFFFVFLAANFRAPPSFNLVGELILFVSFSSFSFLSLAVLGIVSFIVAYYCIYAYSNSAQGEVWKFKGFFILSDYDWMIFLFHILPIFLILLFIREI